MHFPPGYLTCSYSQAVIWMAALSAIVGSEKALQAVGESFRIRSAGVSRLFMTYGYQEACRDLFESSLSVRCTKRWLG